MITHGNGPVVGNILFRMALTSRELVPMPMDVCVAHSQGGIGYMLQQSLANVLARRGLRHGVSSIVTEVEVDRRRPGVRQPDQAGRTVLQRGGRQAHRRRDRLGLRGGLGARLAARGALAACR